MGVVIDIKDAITYFEVKYYTTGGYPPVEQFLQETGTTIAEFSEIYEDLNKALVDKRGLDYLPFEKIAPPVETNKPRRLKGLDPHFALAANLISDPGDKRSKTAKLKEAGITHQRWNALLKKADHKQYFEMLVEERFSGIETTGKIALGKLVEGGDLNAIKYAYEFTGKYRPNQELVMNLGVMIGKIMEILVKHVDPKILETVADELETILPTPNIHQTTNLNPLLGSYEPSNPLLGEIDVTSLTA